MFCSVMFPFASIPRSDRKFVVVPGLPISAPFDAQFTTVFDAQLLYEYSQTLEFPQATEGSHLITIWFEVGRVDTMVGVTEAPPLIPEFVGLKDPPFNALKMFVAVLYIAFEILTITP